jgi:hypothetical protein
MTDESVPDLYRLAFIPGQFRCPLCSFQWSIQTINLERGEIGTTEENRQAPDCPNDGTRMVHVTYREQLECYAERLKEELDKVDKLNEELKEAKLAYGKLFNKNGELTGLLELLYDKWENGTACYEDPDDPSVSSIGNAFKLTFEEEKQIIGAIQG